MTLVPNDNRIFYLKFHGLSNVFRQKILIGHYNQIGSVVIISKIAEIAPHLKLIC